MRERNIIDCDTPSAFHARSSEIRHTSSASSKVNFGTLFSKSVGAVDFATPVSPQSSISFDASIQLVVHVLYELPVAGRFAPEHVDSMAA